MGFLVMKLKKLQSFEFFLFLGSLFSPFVDVFTELFIEFTLFGFLSGFQEVSISLFRAHLRSARLRFCLSFFYFFFLLLFLFFFSLLLFLFYFLLLIVFFVRHDAVLFVGYFYHSH